MDIIIKNELDPLFEVISLLTLCHFPDWKEKTKQEMEALGINMDTYFNKKEKMIDTYLKTFQKYKITAPEEDFLFEDSDFNSSLLLTVLAVEFRNYWNMSPKPSIMDLRSFLAYHLRDNIDHTQAYNSNNAPSLEDDAAIIKFLDDTDLPKDEKWYMMDILRRPDEYLHKLLLITDKNMPAFFKAKESIAKPLEKELKRFEKQQSDYYLKIAEICSRGPVIYTTLAYPFTQIVLYTYGYQGIFSDCLNVTRKESNSSISEIIHQLKALSDKSKLDILMALQASSRYNLELAEVLKLSPSTISYHMNALLICGFITVEKRNGKVYYCLQKEIIKEFLTNLERILLN